MGKKDEAVLELAGTRGPIIGALVNENKRLTELLADRDASIKHYARNQWKAERYDRIVEHFREFIDEHDYDFDRYERDDD